MKLEGGAGAPGPPLSLIQAKLHPEGCEGVDDQRQDAFAVLPGASQE